MYNTVEPRLSGTSIIRHGNSLKKNLKMGVSAAVTMDTGMFICCLSIKWVDQGVVYPIRLSSYPACMALEQRCPDNRGSTVVFVAFQMAAFFVGNSPTVEPVLNV